MRVGAPADAGAFDKRRACVPALCAPLPRADGDPFRAGAQCTAAIATTARPEWYCDYEAKKTGKSKGAVKRVGVRRRKVEKELTFLSASSH
jgi:hypothetical protein